MIKTIGFVNESNPFVDRRAWSGTIFKLREGIEKAGYRVIWIPVKPRGRYIRMCESVLHFFSHSSVVNLTDCLVKNHAKRVDTSLLNECDALFLTDPQITKYLDLSDKPIIYYGDSTYHLMLDYYWPKQADWVVKQSENNERIGLDNSTIVLKASQWAADSAINDYNQSPSKVRVLELGANVDDKDLVLVSPFNGNGTLNILFSGVEWERKGAAIAIDTVKELNKRGVASKLYLCGLNVEKIPAEYQNLPFVEYMGFLNKNDAEQYKTYASTFRKCHMLLLPTLAECAGIVFCEASAVGLPSITYNTGGVSSYVHDGLNGYKLNLGQNYTDFADCIQRILDNDELPELSASGLKLYEDKLSWKAWSRRFAEIMKDL